MKNASLIPPFSKGEGVRAASLVQTINKFRLYIVFALQRNTAWTAPLFWRGGWGVRLLLAALLLCGAGQIDAQVSAGGSHSLFRCSSGEVIAVGGNTYGQLGDSTMTQRILPIRLSGFTG